MIRIVIKICLIAAVFIFVSCGDKDEKKRAADSGDAAFSPAKDKEIQRYNLQVRKDRTASRTDCDTIALIEYIMDTFQEGTYLVFSDTRSSFDVPLPAVVYNNEYIFAVIARSRPGERLIERKNITGFDESYIDYDSTKLGTAFFDLVLFQCTDNSFKLIWEAPIPSHGGFNSITYSTWSSRQVPKISVNFYYAHKRGAIDYNYYLINGITEPPHLLMTYAGINFRRTEADINKDEFPDYYEHIFYDTENRIIHKDSTAFVWNPLRNLYVNTGNRKQTRPY